MLVISICLDIKVKKIINEFMDIYDKVPTNKVLFLFIKLSY